MSEASYTAWDDNLYEWPPPDGWYQADDGKWWPEGYGPTGADSPDDPSGNETGNNGIDDAGASLLFEVERTSIFPAGGSGLVGTSSTEERIEAESQRPVYDELPPIDDVFGGIDPYADDDDRRPAAFTGPPPSIDDLPGLTDDPDPASASAEVEEVDDLVGGEPAVESAGFVIGEPDDDSPAVDHGSPAASVADAGSDATVAGHEAGPDSHRLVDHVEEEVEAVDASLGSLEDEIEAVDAGLEELEDLDPLDEELEGLESSQDDEVEEVEGLESVEDDGVEEVEDLESVGDDELEDLEPLDEELEGLESVEDDEVGELEGLESVGDDEVEELEGLESLQDDEVGELEGLESLQDDEVGAVDAGVESLEGDEVEAVDAGVESLEDDEVEDDGLDHPGERVEDVEDDFDPAAAVGAGLHLGELPDTDIDIDEHDDSGQHELVATGYRREGRDTRSRLSWPLIAAGLAVLLVGAGVVAFLLLRTDDAPVGFDVEAALAQTGNGSLSEPYASGTGVVVFYNDEVSGRERRWVIQVVDTVADRTDQLIATDAELSPADGEVLAVTRIRVTYQSGPSPGPASDLALSSIGASLTLFGPVQACARVDDQLALSTTLEPGQAVEGNLCWRIPSADLTDLKLAVQARPVDGIVFMNLT